MTTLISWYVSAQYTLGYYGTFTVVAKATVNPQGEPFTVKKTKKKAKTINSLLSETLNRVKDKEFRS
jgi:hypothetical protein